ncbi:hypothetical protein PR048_022465 [Dryococelus australis]|uniref:Uncharacterized protein n=1 Tax=Dryococelus australis TaxID=614101 RepID=A0ABQ9H168_9NEOP|nr:hypothetical protein PR048_022465 [Dryococelus australis]
MMPLVGGFARGSPVFPVLSFWCCSILISIALIGSQDLAVKSHPDLFTHYRSPLSNGTQVYFSVLCELHKGQYPYKVVGVRTPVGEESMSLSKPVNVVSATMERQTVFLVVYGTSHVSPLLGRFVAVLHGELGPCGKETEPGNGQGSDKPQSRTSDTAKYMQPRGSALTASRKPTRPWSSHVLAFPVKQTH